jgi:RNA polymerase sigma-70 factor (ECF subfamily)
VDRAVGVGGIGGEAGGDFALVLAAARAGDDRAWDQLLRHLMGPLLGYLRLRGAPEPDDLVNEVLLRAARGLRRFRGDRDQFRSWVFTIAHHLLVDDRRRRGRLLAMVDLDRLGDAEPADGDGGADGPVEAGWSATHVQDMLARLTPDQRDVLLLRIVGGFRIDEVAAIVAKEPNAVKQLQYRGLRTLRRLLAQDGERPAEHQRAGGEVAR